MGRLTSGRCSSSVSRSGAEAALRVDHQHDDVGIARAAPGRGDHGAVEPALRREDAGRIDEDQLRRAISAMPRTGTRVVCALWVTIETLAPTSALTSVDLPAFGAPIMATKPQRVFLAVRRVPLSHRVAPARPLRAAAWQRRGLLGGALAGALPALGC